MAPERRGGATPVDRGVYARVHGIVQGVGFRYAAVSHGRTLGLSGYVKNLDDGSVEVVAEGSEAAVAQMLDWLKRGPTGARVTAVDHRTTPATGTYRGFSVAW